MLGSRPLKNVSVLRSFTFEVPETSGDARNKGTVTEADDLLKRIHKGKVSTVKLVVARNDVALSGRTPLRQQCSDRAWVLIRWRDLDEEPRIKISEVVEGGERLGATLRVTQEFNEPLPFGGHDECIDERRFVIH
jgi:hypothetical protein